LSLPTIDSTPGIDPDLPPEKELELLREKVKKADAEIKKAQMQGRILQKKSRRKIT